MESKKLIYSGIMVIGLFLTSFSLLNTVHHETLINENSHLKVSQSSVNFIQNGDFESGTNDSWTANLTRPTIAYSYGVKDTYPHAGTYSYHIYGFSDSRTGELRGFILEVSQNITLTNPPDFNISGYMYVNQCYSAEYGAWACIFIKYYNNENNILGRINYRFASVYEDRILPWVSGSVIPLYNKLKTWLEFNRNISYDFINIIGGDPQEVTQIELGFFVYAADGSQSGAGDIGYCEVYFDDWVIEYVPAPSEEWINPFSISSSADGNTRFVITPDIDGDGMEDILVNINDAGEIYLNAYSWNGTLLWNKSDCHYSRITGAGGNLVIGRFAGWNAWWNPVSFDDNGDGLEDILIHFENGTAGALSGKDGTFLWKVDLFTPSGTYLQELIPDITGDGKPEVVVTSSRGTGSMDGYIGVMNSATKELLWSIGQIGISSDYNVRIEVIPDVNGNGTWDIMYFGYYVYDVRCVDGLTGNQLWVHNIGGGDCLGGVRRVPDLNGDGIFEAVIAPQAANFQVIFGNNGSEYWASGYTQWARYPTPFITEEGYPFVAFDDERTAGAICDIRVLDLSLKKEIGVKVMPKGSFFTFMDNPIPYQPDYHICKEVSLRKVDIFYIANYTKPITTLPYTWDWVTPYYGDFSGSKRCLVTVNKSHIGFFTLSLPEAPSLPTTTTIATTSYTTTTATTTAPYTTTTTTTTAPYTTTTTTPYTTTTTTTTEPYTTTTQLLPSAPSRPLNLQASIDDNQVKLVWQKPLNDGAGITDLFIVLDYNVYRGSQSGGPYALIGSTTTLNYVDKNVVSDTTYYYVVTAENDFGESENSNEVTIAIPGVTTSSSGKTSTPAISPSFPIYIVFLSIFLLTVLLRRKKKKEFY
ncbi:MAG: hypothetical protein ACFFB5_05800 [Promethearchaeota archaeon]